MTRTLTELSRQASSMPDPEQVIGPFSPWPRKLRRNARKALSAVALDPAAVQANRPPLAA